MLGRWLRPAYCASTSVTFEPARHTSSILFEPLLGCWGCRRMGAKSGGEKLRKSEWPARILCSTGNSPLHFLSTHTFASSSIDWVLSALYINHRKQPTSLRQGDGSALYINQRCGSTPKARNPCRLRPHSQTYD